MNSNASMKYYTTSSSKIATITNWRTHFATYWETQQMIRNYCQRKKNYIIWFN